MQKAGLCQRFDKYFIVFLFRQMLQRSKNKTRV